MPKSVFVAHDANPSAIFESDDVDSDVDFLAAVGHVRSPLLMEIGIGQSVLHVNRCLHLFCCNV